MGRAAKIALTAALMLLPSQVAADARYRIGIILPGDAGITTVDGLKEGMAALGYVEGRDVRYLVENAKRDKARIATLTQRFIAERVDVIYTITNTALKIVSDGTNASRTPVVFGSASGPVETGLVASYAAPAKHITGVTSASIQLVAKRLELLKEVISGVKRVTVVGSKTAGASAAAFAIAAEAAPKLGLTVIDLRVAGMDEAVAAVSRLSRRETDAVLLLPGLFAVSGIDKLTAAATAVKLPFGGFHIEHVTKQGALMSYGSSYYLQGKQSASLVDKVLRGVPPDRIPIERPVVHELVLNLAVARTVGVQFSREVLNRADALVGDPAR